MSWDSITRYGNGRVRYAIVIEGWPEIWVTDHSLTLSSSADGRTVRVGLKRDGLSFSERAQLSQGRLEASAMTFKIAGNDHQDTATESFARVGQPAGVLASDLSTTGIALTGLAGCPAAGYYHIGTEAFFSDPEGAGTNPWPLAARGVWDTQAQSFSTSDGGIPLVHHIYYHPTTAEGRRVTLYAWGDGDSGAAYDPTGADTSLGRPIWRGIISTPPRPAEGKSWTITADHVSTVFRQSIAARNREIRPVGIYHSAENPFYIAVARHGSSGMTLSFAHKHLMFAESHGGFLAQINDLLADAIASSETTLSSFFEEITISYDPATDQYRLDALTVASPGSFTGSNAQMLVISSHVAGAVIAGLHSGLHAQHWVNLDGGDTVHSASFDSSGFTTFEGDARYYCYLHTPEWRTRGASEDAIQPWFRAVTNAFDPAGFGAGPSYDYRVATDSTTPASSAAVEFYTGRRIWIDQDWGALSSNAVTVDLETIEASPFRENEGSIELVVEDSGDEAGVYWILVDYDDATKPFYGWAHADTVIRPTFVAAGPTDVIGFIDTLIDTVAENANDGDLPFIRHVDFDTSTLVRHRHGGITAARRYAFSKPVAIEEVIGEELKMVAHMMTTDRDSAKVKIVPIPILTPSISATLDDDGDPIAVGSEQIQTPAGGSGAFPTYEIQSQGLVSTVSLKTGYIASKDEHAGMTYTASDAGLLGTHKRRGVTDLTIAPKSEGPPITLEVANEIAANILAVLGREYATIKVRVPFTRFRLMLGDVVLFTSPHVPNTQGTRGLSNARALVIGRRWNLDPERNEHGEIELLVLLNTNAVAGYAPSGFITGQSGSVATWTLTLSAANELNILISPRGDGDVAGTFAVGDKIVLVPLDNDDARVGGDTITGEVTSVSGATMGVALDATWTPGSDEWMIEFQSAGDVETTQLVSCFVAGPDAQIDNTHPARLLS
jgi:hypothetical protein